MALNISFDGYVYFGNSSLSNANVAYQAYFYHVNSGSSTSTWNDVRIVESTGYYSFNLGDGDFLSQTGSGSSGDVVLIVFWSPVTADRLDACSSLNEWSIFRVVLDGSDTYTNAIQIKSNICPNLSWSLPATGMVNQTISITNSSTDIHQWDFSSNTMYHRNSWYTTLMAINAVDNTDYDWGDLTQSNDLTGAASTTHSWSSAGTYDVQIVIEDECGCTVTGTDQIDIYNNAPVPNIEMVDVLGTTLVPDPNELVYFKYTGTDLNDAITNIAWTIEDTGSYGTTNTISATNARDDIISHSSGLGTDWYGEAANSGAFTNPGNHTVSIVYEYWNGFTTVTGTYSEVFSQGKFSGPEINFTQEPTEATLSSGITFTNTSTNISRVGLGLPDNIEYTWTWNDDGTIETVTDVAYTYELEKIPSSASCTVELCAQWSDGWETQETCTEKDVVFKTTVTISEEECYYNLNIIGTSDDGSVSSYGWTIYSGTGSTGPWTETWSSPIDINQNDKKVCFTAVGYYKIEGTVYGTGNSTSDDEVLYVTEVCAPGEETSYVICPPTVVPTHVGNKHISAKETKPSLKGRMDLQPSVRVVHNTTNKPFPGPINI